LLFDSRPKESKKDLYDAENELKILLTEIKRGTPLITIVGLRRTGKTSLLLVAFSQLKLPHVILDLRVLANKQYATKKDLIQETERALNIFYRGHLGVGKRLLKWLKRIQGVGVSQSGISISWGGKEPAELAALFDELDSWAKQEKTRIVVAFDEAQELKKIAGIDMAKLLAHVYDYCRNIVIILTGSAVGLLDDFLSSNDPGAPLYGRDVTEIRLHRLTDEMARDFLLRGFKQARVKVDRTMIDLAIQRLDGIIGWLTLFGNTCLKSGKASERAVEHTAEVGKGLAKQEFENFLKGREVASARYRIIVRALSESPSSWAGLKRAVETEEGRTVNDRNLTELISNLVKGGFVEKKDDSYLISDPMLIEAFQS
jgi:uncharacterized protein